MGERAQYSTRETWYLFWTRLSLFTMPAMGVAYVFGFWIDIGDRAGFLLSLAFPPLLLISFLGLAVYHNRASARPMLFLAAICTAMATTTILMMITVQASLRANLLEEFQQLEEGTTKSSALWALRAVDQTQLSFDVAWDVWISIAVVAFGIGLLSKLSTRLENLSGLIGIACGGGGLAINLWAFPETPTGIGLPDPGILFFVWFAIMAVLLYANASRGRKHLLERLTPRST